MPEEDRPPEHIWLLDERIAEHFDHIAEKRKYMFSGQEAVPQADVTQNELTAEIRR